MNWSIYMYIFIQAEHSIAHIFPNNNLFRLQAMAQDVFYLFRSPKSTTQLKIKTAIFEYAICWWFIYKHLMTISP